MLQRSVKLIKTYAEVAISESGELFNLLAEFIDNSVASWNDAMKDEILRLVLDASVFILVVLSHHKACDKKGLPNKLIFDFFKGFSKRMKSIALTETLQDDLLMLPKSFGCHYIRDGWIFLLESCSDLIFWTSSKDKNSGRTKVIDVD